MSIRTYMVQYVGRSLRLPRLERQVDVIYEHGTGREYWLAETAEMQQTGYATAICSRCGVEFQGSICSNEPPDYVVPLERCPRCGARFRT